MRLAIVIVVLFALLPASAAAQGRIEQIRRDAGSSSDSNKDKDRSDDDCASDDSSSSGSSNSDASGAGDFGIGLLFADFFFAPFSMPHRSLDDDWDTRAFFPDYPYFR